MSSFVSNDFIQAATAIAGMTVIALGGGAFLRKVDRSIAKTVAAEFEQRRLRARQRSEENLKEFYRTLKTEEPVSAAPQPCISETGTGRAPMKPKSPSP